MLHGAEGTSAGARPRLSREEQDCSWACRTWHWLQTLCSLGGEHVSGEST